MKISLQRPNARREFTLWRFLLCLGLTLVMAEPIAAQRLRGSGWEANSAFNRMYNPQSVETVRGKVTQVNRIAPLREMGPGIHVSLQTATQTLAVHLGPAWFVERQDVQIEPNDQIEVTGSRVSIDGQATLIATEVKKGDDMLTLRTEEGEPVWSAAGRTTSARSANRRSPAMKGPDHMGPRMMGQRQSMTEQRHRMMENHTHMLSRWKSQDEELQQQLVRMNKTKGEEKVEAIADIVRSWVYHRQQMLERMTAMHENMMAQMGGSGHAPGSSSARDNPESPEHASEPTGRTPGSIRMPPALSEEHDELHAEMTRAVQAGGRTGQAAQEVQARLTAHFHDENELAMPPLGLLAEIVTQGPSEHMRPAITLAKEVENRLPRFLEEHVRIAQSLQRLESAAAAEGKTEQVTFARRLRRHAQTEEQVLYPATILIGRYLEDRLSNEK